MPATVICTLTALLFTCSLHYLVALASSKFLSTTKLTAKDVSYSYSAMQLIMTDTQVVDKSVESSEVFLSTMDFLRDPVEREVDLRELGIKVADDPTMGNKMEGDIAMPNFKRMMDEQPDAFLARSSIRQSYRLSHPAHSIPFPCEMVLFKEMAQQRDPLFP